MTVALAQEWELNLIAALHDGDVKDSIGDSSHASWPVTASPIDGLSLNSSYYDSIMDVDDHHDFFALAEEASPVVASSKSWFRFFVWYVSHMMLLLHVVLWVWKFRGLKDAFQRRRHWYDMLRMEGEPMINDEKVEGECFSKLDPPTRRRTCPCLKMLFKLRILRKMFMAKWRARVQGAGCDEAESPKESECAKVWCSPGHFQRWKKCVKRRKQRRFQQFMNRCADEKNCCSVFQKLYCHLSSLHCPVECALSALQAYPPPLPMRRGKCTKESVCEIGDYKNIAAEEITETTASEEDIIDKAIRAEPSSSPLRTPRQSRSHKRKSKSRRSRKSFHFHDQTLLDLARMQQWNQLSSLLSNADNHQNPSFLQAISKADADGLLPLHWICAAGKKAPTEAVLVLLRLHPEGAATVTSDGTTPLHLACHYGASYEVVQELLRAAPSSASSTDSYGRTSLSHAVCHGASSEVLRLLIQANPAAITQSCRTITSLSSIATTGGSSKITASLPSRSSREIHFNDHDSRDFATTPLYAAWAMVVRECRRMRSVTNVARGKTWAKAELLLGSDDVITAAAQRYRYLPPVVWAMLVEIYKQKGRLRPHHLSQAAHWIPSASSDEALRVLLEAYQGSLSSSESDRNGHSPSAAVRAAVTSGKSWHEGIGRLVRSHPEALYDSSRPAFAVPNAEPDAVYRLLRSNPSVIMQTQN